MAGPLHNTRCGLLSAPHSHRWYSSPAHTTRGCGTALLAHSHSTARLLRPRAAAMLFLSPSSPRACRCTSPPPFSLRWHNPPRGYRSCVHCLSPAVGRLLASEVHDTAPLGAFSGIDGWWELSAAMQKAAAASLSLLLREHYSASDASLREYYRRDAAAFVDAAAVDGLQCCACAGVLWRPVELDCSSGHLMCAGCWLSWFSLRSLDGQTAPCPFCKTPIDHRLVRHSRFAQRTIESMTVRCVNAERGCSERIMIGINARNLSDHSAKCAYQLVACQHCDQPVQRSLLDSHLASDCKWWCNGCQREVRTADRERHERQSDEYKFWCTDCVLCPNQCNLDLVLHRDDLDAHLVVCPKQLIHCGLCEAQHAREQTDEHHKQQAVAHIRLLTERQSAQQRQMQQQIEAQQQCIAMLTQQLSSMQQKEKTTRRPSVCRVSETEDEAEAESVSCSVDDDDRRIKRRRNSMHYIA